MRYFTSLFLALILLSMSAPAFAHKRAEAKLRIDASDAPSEVILEMHEDDLGELVYPQKHLLGEVPEDLAGWREGARAKLPEWMALQSGESACPTSLLALERVGLRGVRLELQADCVVDSVTWKVHEASLLELRAATSLRGAGDRQARAVLYEGDTTLELNAEVEQSKLEEAWRFLLLGIEHILTGWDHLAFLLALVLACATIRRLFWVVSGFTVAHSVTLVLGALGVVNLSGAIVEPIIAASIALTAGFQLWRLWRRELTHPGKQDVRDGVPWPEVMICLGFGLIHGLGFAGMLAESLGQSSSDLLLPVISFNAGVELGQLAIVLVAFPALVWVGEQTWGKRFFGALLAGLVLLGVIVAALRILG